MLTDLEENRRQTRTFENVFSTMIHDIPLQPLKYYTIPIAEMSLIFESGKPFKPPTIYITVPKKNSFLSKK